MGFLDYSLMFAMVALYAFQSFFCKKFTLSYPGDEKNAAPVFTVVGGIVVAIVSIFFSGFKFTLSPLTLFFGLLNAFALYFYNFFMIKAAACGPYSVLIVFSIVGDIVIPALVKFIGFDEGMTGPAICFMLLIILSVYLMSTGGKDGQDESKVSLKFILFSLGLGISNGAYGSILAVQQKITGENEKEELIIVTFLAAAVISSLTLIKNKTPIKKAFAQTKKSFTYLCIYSLIAAFAINSLVVLMLLEINTGVLYTVQNAGVMLMSVALSLVFFKEKLSKISTIGCAIMAVSLVGIMACADVTFADILKLF